MYLAFKHSHLLTAALSILMTLVWLAVAWRGGAVWGGKTKVTYIMHRAVAGLAGLTGLVLTFIGPWQAMLFPYVGLALFVVHGLAAGMSKRHYVGNAQAGKRQIALGLQVVVILASSALMAIKPF